MEEIGEREMGEKMSIWYGRDAANVRAAQAVVLIGADKKQRGVPYCGYCGFANCNECKNAGLCIPLEEPLQRWVLFRIVCGWGFRFQFQVKTSFLTGVFSVIRFQRRESYVLLV